MIRIRDMLDNVNKAPEWQHILTEQESILRFTQFTCADALRLGNEIVRLAQEAGKAFAVQIELDGAVVFLHHMDGVSRFHDWFIAQKSNVVRETGVSSMRAFLNCVYGGQYTSARWFSCDGNYVLCGGSIPITLADGTIAGIVTASGGAHEEDHQLVAFAMASLLGADIPSLPDGDSHVDQGGK